MFVDIENTSSICKGDILYLKESQSTLMEFHGCAIRVEQIEDDKYIDATVPNKSWVKKVGVDSWNKSLDFDSAHTHFEVGMHVSRLSRPFEENEDISVMLSEFC